MAGKFCLLCAVVAFSETLGCALVGSAGSGASSPSLQDAAPAIEMVFVKGGCFAMGTALGAAGGPEEKPAHEVCVDDFHIGKHEVTQGQWRMVMGRNPSAAKDCGEDCPVEMVSWNDAQAFLARLNDTVGAKDGSSGRFRLPTEAEWEYAARSGGRSEKFSGAESDVDSVAWYLDNSTGTHPVGTKAPNGLGIHDMSGNVWEWTADWYGATYYSSSPRNNPTGPGSGDRRVLRGGSYGNSTFDSRTAFRDFLPPEYRSGSKGLRLLRATPARAQ